MRYLALALYAEGPTDYRFLSPILRRVADDLCLREAAEPVSIREEVLALDAPKGERFTDRASRILAAAKAADGAFDILFVHADGAGDPRRARDERVQPAIHLMTAERPGWSDGVVAVVPVRETEAWALADGDALRAAFGTNLGSRTELTAWKVSPTRSKLWIGPANKPRAASDRVARRRLCWNLWVNRFGWIDCEEFPRFESSRKISSELSARCGISAIVELIDRVRQP
jgi:Domain of unknown function (DUF4276)